MNCKKCGREVDSKDKICKSCGTPVEERKSAFHVDGISWDLEGFPSDDKQNQKDIEFNWISITEEKKSFRPKEEIGFSTREESQLREIIEDSKPEKKPAVFDWSVGATTRVDRALESHLMKLEKEALERERLSNEGEKKTDNVGTLQNIEVETDNVEKLVIEKGIGSKDGLLDKFYEVNQENEAFQSLLDQEYERLRDRLREEGELAEEILEKKEENLEEARKRWTNADLSVDLTSLLRDDYSEDEEEVKEEESNVELEKTQQVDVAPLYSSEVEETVNLNNTQTEQDLFKELIDNTVDRETPKNVEAMPLYKTAYFDLYEIVQPQKTVTVDEEEETTNREVAEKVEVKEEVASKVEDKELSPQEQLEEYIPKDASKESSSQREEQKSVAEEAGKEREEIKQCYTGIFDDDEEEEGGWWKKKKPDNRATTLFNRDQLQNSKDIYEDEKKEEVESVKEVEENTKPKKKKKGFGHYFLDFIILVLLVIIALCGITAFMPESTVGKKVNELLNQAISIVTSETKDSNRASNSENQLSSMEKIIKETSVDNKNIGKIISDNNVVFLPNGKYNLKNMENSTTFSDTLWYTDDNGKVISYNQGIVKTIVSFYSDLVDSYRKGSDDELKYVDEKSPLYQQLKSLKEDKSFSIDKLSIGEVRNYNENYYVRVALEENVNKELKKIEVGVHLVAKDKTMKIVNISEDN